MTIASHSQPYIKLARRSGEIFSMEISIFIKETSPYLYLKPDQMVYTS
jgi:hypothetical protein